MDEWIDEWIENRRIVDVYKQTVVVIELYVPYHSEMLSCETKLFP